MENAILQLNECEINQASGGLISGVAVDWDWGGCVGGAIGGAIAGSIGGWAGAGLGAAGGCIGGALHFYTY